MSGWDKVTQGKKQKNVFCLLYGPDGVGKSTFGADAPNPIFLGTEEGTNHLDVMRWPAPKAFTDCIVAIQDLCNDSRDRKTLVIDSLDWLEPILWSQIAAENKVTSIELVGGGYGKGYTEANLHWHKMVNALKMLREKMHIIVLAHSQIKTFHDPTTSHSYDRYQLKLNDKAGALWREAVDAVLFANYEVYAKKDSGQARAFGEGRRLIYTERRPAFDAKNRYGLPMTLPLSWDEFFTAAFKGEVLPAAELREQISELLKNVKDGEYCQKVLDYVSRNSEDAVQLSKALDRVREKIHGSEA